MEIVGSTKSCMKKTFVYGDANCVECDVFHILHGKYSGERCVLENSDLNEGVW